MIMNVKRLMGYCLAVVAATTLVACDGVMAPGSGDGAGDVIDGGDGSDGSMDGGDGTDGTTDGSEGTDGTSDGTDAGSANLVIFVDDAEGSTFSTTDVRDVDDEIVQFDSQTMAIVWKATGASYQTGSWVTEGNFLGSSRSFQVRFGTVGGDRRAYFTETGPATICNIRVSGESLSISPTSVTVPNE